MGMTSGSIRQTGHFHRDWTTLLVVVSLGSTGHLLSPSWAQEECGVAGATKHQVQNQIGVDILRAAANCTDGGSLEAGWAGAVTLDSPIVVAAGMFLSITGENTEAEVRGDSQTRMFEVSRGGGLTLTRLKVSGGAAESGGAILSDSASLTLDSCIFQDNEATNGHGGAVWADGGNVTIVGGEFLDNNASRNGGAVAATGAGLVIREGCIFEGNKGLVGGALFYTEVAESESALLAAFCSLSDTEFIANTATGESEETALLIDSSEGVDGGGAVALLFASANVTDSVFSGNYAQFSGGAVAGGNGTDITVSGCTFDRNTAANFGGAIAGASMTLGGDTQLTNNTSGAAGGAVFGWNLNGLVIFNDVVCSQNTAGGYGGCFRNGGTSYINNGTVMHGNVGLNGGCIYAYDGGKLHVIGGHFTCRSSRQGGFLRAGDNTLVKITGGVIANNVAGDRGGAISCGTNGGTTLNIEGGTFRENTALELGGVISARGQSTLVNITGGMFSNNTAKLFGGFLHLTNGASLSCEGVTVENNYAGSQGGGIYARSSPWVNSTCDLIGNQSPQGAALYLSRVDSVMLKDHSVSDNLAFSGSVVFVVDTSVVANGVSFTSNVGLQEDSSNRAVQSNKNSVLNATNCAFDGWQGDTVIYHSNAEVNSLHLDSCDFSGSSTSMAVFSLSSDAKIRNAVADDTTFINAGRINNTVALVNRALDCSSPGLCGPGTCLDSALGVLCECLDVDTCLGDGGEVLLAVKTPPANEIYSPGAVSFELVVSSAISGTTYAIWNLEFDAKDLNLDVTPSSGIFPPGANTTIVITGTPTIADINGNLVSNFNLKSVGSLGSSSSSGIALEVNSTYYLCMKYKYAKPQTAEEGDSFSCPSCMSISGGEGVDCDSPGAVLASLPIRQGYWRSGPESLVVHTCGNSEACVGATEISSSDAYCANGYQGPYCAVCSAGYARGVSNTCHSCDDANRDRVIISASAIAFGIVFLLLAIVAVVFLIGGVDGVDMVRKSISGNVSRANRVSSFLPEAEARWQKRPYIGERTRNSNANDNIAPAFDFTWESRHRASERDVGDTGESLPQTRSWQDDGGKARFVPSDDIGRGVGSIELSDTPARQKHAGVGLPARHHACLSTAGGTVVGGELENHGEEILTNDGGTSKCSDIGVKMRNWASRLPLDKVKILVVVWQIQGMFASITRVEFPPSYSMFLSWISVVSFDIWHFFSASCIVPSVNFYASLLITTLVPLVLVTGLVFTYHMAVRRAGIGTAGVIARKAAWARHVAAGLLLTFLVFTSASTTVFETFVCDDDVGNGKSYLRTDYSILCGSSWHIFFKGYAMLMIMVYPIGIPALYAVILWSKRELLNPRSDTTSLPESDRAGETASRDDSAAEGGSISSFLRKTLSCQTENEELWQDLQSSKEREKARRENPELTPFVFLWKDFDPGLYYYEVIECGRRILLTGALVFVAPNSPTQIATACVLAFGSLLGFEIVRPHLDAKNTFLYRMGCVVIFFSYFLAFLIKVDAADEDRRAAFAFFLVVSNVFLVVAFFTTSWFAFKKPMDDFKADDITQR